MTFNSRERVNAAHVLEDVQLAMVRFESDLGETRVMIQKAETEYDLNRVDIWIDEVEHKLSSAIEKIRQAKVAMAKLRASGVEAALTR